MDRLLGLSVFVTTVEQGSLTSAARALGMTPAMAGKHVAVLEATLGVRLLHRTTRKLHMTSAGEEYYYRSRHILDSLDEADRAARQLQDEPRGLLRIAAPTSFGPRHLSGPLATFMEQHPGVRVEMNLADAVTDLVAGGLDLAIRIGGLPDSSLVARRLSRTSMLACATPSYLATRGRPHHPTDLQNFDRLAFSRATTAGDWSFTDRVGHVHKVSGTVRLLADNMDMLLYAALAGAGIVYGPAFIFADYLQSNQLEQVLGDYTTESLDIHAVYPSSLLVPAKLRRLIGFLSNWFIQNAAWEVTDKVQILPDARQDEENFREGI